MNMNQTLCETPASYPPTIRRNVRPRLGGFTWLTMGLVLLLNGAAAQAQYSGNNQTNMISGVISNWTGNYIVGNTNTSRDVLIVTNAGVLNVSAIAYIGKYTSNNVGIVTGPGSILSNSSTFYVGQYGSSNSLTIANGGLIYNKTAGNIGAYTWASYNSVTVTDPGSVWSNNTAINVGYNSLGWGGAYNTLTITNGGAVFVPMIRIGGSTHTSNNVVTISSGILAVNSIQNYDGSDQLVVAGGTLQPYSTNGAWSAVMVVNNAVTLNTVDLGGQPRTNTLSSTVAGAGVMNITGAGVLRWNGTATGGSVINVTNGTTLAGNGSAATVQIQSNATLAAGIPLGTLTATNLTLVGGAVLQVQLNAPTGTKGVDWNLLSVNGPVTLSGISSGAPLTVNVMNSGGLDGVNLPVATRSWDFLDATGITGFDSNAVTITTTGLASWTNGIWSVVQSGNSLQLNYVLPPATISVAANLPAAGAATGGGIYAPGTNVVLTATPSNGWVFASWSDSTTNNPHTITVPVTNSTYTANFVVAATVTGNSSTNAGGTVTGGGAYAVGGTAVLTATASNGWAFAGWDTGMTNNPYSITVPASNITYTAKFVWLAQFTTLYTFTGGNDGGLPWGALTLSGDGTLLYGMTENYGTNLYYGTAFALGTNGAFTILHAFTGGNDGGNAYGALTRSGDGTTLYGMTASGGVSNSGTAFALGTNEVFTTLYAFTGGNDGGFPNGSLTLSGDGTTFYGMTSQGGVSNSGTAFALGTNGVFTTLYAFTGGNDGGYPYGSVTLSGDGTTLYGMTKNGGANSVGTAFALGTNGVFTTLYAFTGGTDGANPNGSLILSGNGTTLYGMTPNNGANGYGTVFALGTNGVFTTLYTFTGGSDGGIPKGDLTFSTDGTKLYGMTAAWSGGGGSSDGLIFQMNLDGSGFKPLHSFSGGSDGSDPEGSLILSGNGSTLYGMTRSGGGPGLGTAFALTLQMTISVAANPVAGGTVTGGGFAAFGSPVVLTATPSNGWLFASWSDGSTNNPHSITAPQTNITYTANFAVSNCTYAVASSSTNVAASAGSGSVGITAGVGCTWTATNNVNWLTITGGSSGTGNGTISYTVAANTGNCTNRIGTLTIGGQTFTVTQASGTGSYGLATASTNVLASASSGSVNLTAGVGCAWTAASSSTNWLHTTSSGTGNGTVSFTVDANTGNCTNRIGTLTIGGHTFTVTQASGTGSYSLARASTNVTASAGSGSVGITAGAGCAWTATSSTNWLQTTSSGTGNGTISYTVTANTANCTNRTGTITVGGQTFSVTQAGGGGSYSLAVASTNVTASAGSGSVGITAGVGCTWTATSSTNWLQTSSSGTGNGTISYTFAANSTSTNRSGTITVGGQSFTVSQAVPAITITVQANPTNGGTVSGAGTYGVGSTQTIVATATNGWIFTSWTDGGNTQSPRAITVPATNFTYIANFATNQFTYTTNNAAITITGYTGLDGVVIIPSAMNGYPVTNIGNYAFLNNTHVSNVTISASVASLGWNVFVGCSGLSAITVDPSNTVYSSLAGVLFDKSQATLIAYPGGKAGSYTIPASVTNIGDWAFSACTRLTSVTIPASVTSIGFGTFQDSTGLTNITILASITSISSQAFLGCTGLTRFTIPASVTSIGNNAFTRCTGLTSITIPNSVTSIVSGAFWGAGLTNVTIPASVTSIGETAFTSCDHLSAITVDPSNTVYSSLAGVLFNKSQTTLIAYPGGKAGSYTIPASAISIGNWAFAHCTNLTSVPISTSVTNIGTFAFGYCNSLINITIPNSVTSIQDHAFFNCISLASVTIPASVTRIGDGAFGANSQLTGIYFQGNAPSLGSAVFDSDNRATVYYLAGTTGWINPWGDRPTAVWQRPVFIKGTVTNSVTGGGISGAAVSFGSQQAATDLSGNYLLSSTNCLTTNLTVVANGYASFSLAAYAPTCGSTNILNVGLSAATTFGGQVIDFNYDSGAGLSNAGVYWGGYSAGTGNNGTYQFSSVPCLQTTNLIVQAPFYDTYNQPYTPGCGGTNVLIVYLSRSIANLIGTVWNAQTQRGVSNAVVTCGTVTTTTDSNGAYTLQSYCGTWPLSVASPISQTYTSAVTVNNFGTNAVDVWLAPNPTTFGGQVASTATGAGLPNAVVSWGTFRTTTDANGRYQFSAADCNPAKLVVTCPGYQSSTQNYAAACGQISVLNVPLAPANLVITNVWATQQPDNTVAITYNLMNPFGQPVNVTVAVSANNGLTFNVPAVSLTPTNGSAITSGNNRSITWAAATDWSNQTSAAMVIRLTAVGSGQTCAAVSPAITVSTLTSNAPPLITDVITTETYADQTPYVRGVYSNGSQRAYFLAGVSCPIHLQVHTAWNGHAPGQFQVTGTQAGFNQAATNAAIALDLSSDLSRGAALTIVAVAADGMKSQPFRVNLDVIPVPPGLPVQVLRFNPAQSCYTIPNFNIFEGVALSGAVNIPVQGPDVAGQTGASFQSQWAMAGTLGLDGSYSTKLQTGSSTDNWSMAGFSIKPTVTAGVQGQWQPNQGTFNDSGSATIAAHYQVATTVKPTVAGLQLPATLKGYVTANQVAGLTFSRNQTNGWQFSGNFPVTLALSVANSLGYDWNNAQISIVGSITAGFAYPQSPYVSGVNFTIASVVKQQSLVWTWGSQQPPVSTYFALQPGITADQFNHELSRQIARALPKRPANSEFQLMSRDYQHRPVAIKQRAGLTRGRTAQRQDLVSASSSAITRNVFPQSQPQLGVSGTNAVLLWVRDNPARSTENCMELVWQHRQGASWSSPLPVWDNGTGDAEPVVGVFPNGTILAVWQKQASVLPAGTSLSAALTNTLIATALYDPATGLWMAENLTSPNGCQHTPHLAVAADGTALLTWIGNASADTLGSAAAPNTVFARRWNGTGWDSVHVISANVPMLLNSTLAYDGSNGVFVATVDGDDQETTQGDQELSGATFANGSWGALTRLTQNAVQDTKPQAVYDSAGRLLVAWYQGSNIVMRTGDLNLAAATVVAKLDGNLSSQDFTLITGSQGQISMVWEDVAADGSGPGPNLVNYDPTLQAWSFPLRLFTQPNELDRAFSGTYATNGALQLAYNAVDVTPDGDTPQFGQVDLMYLDYLIGRDLAVFDSDLSLSSAAVPGQPVTISAIIRNIGEFGAADVAVGFYDGDPGAGGQRIGSLQTIPGILAAGTNALVQMPWTVPNDNAGHIIYVVIDPALAQADRNRANNTATLSALAADLQITSFTVGQPNVTNRLLNAQCLNLGIIPTTRAVAITFRRGAIDGPVLGSALVNPLPTNGVNDASFVWTLAGQTFTSEVVTVYAIVDEANTVPEASSKNKTRSAAVMINLDSVGDGIPDWWRARYFGGNGATTNANSCATCDPNHNSLRNLQEYLSGTNPTDSTSHPVPPVISTISPLPAGTNGVAYSQQFQAYAGVPPYTWSIRGGKLPAGLRLNATSGLLSGIPTASGISNFRIGVTDSQKLSASNDFRVIIRNTSGVLAGTYTGLVMPAATNLPTHANSGLIQLVVVNSGAYAGHLTLAAHRTAFKGQFDVAGNSACTVAGVQLALHADGASGQITGSVTSPDFTSELFAELPDTSAVWQGKYTLVFSPADGLATNLPQGYGYATLSVSRTGIGSLRGVLNDGTPLSATAPMLQAGLWPLYASLYKQAGACLGWLSLATNGTVTATVDWFAPARAGYAAFTTALTLDGSVSTTGLVPGIGVLWDVTLSGGGLSSNLVKTVTFNAAGQGSQTPLGTDTFTLKLAVKTGQFTGSFKPQPGAAAIPFTGLLLQSQGMGAGLFKTATAQTGGILLTPAP